MKILVAEDEFIIALVLEDTLWNAGHDVLGPAATVREALEIASGDVPELAIVDIRLAGKRRGTDLARTLHQQHGTPSIFVTGNTEEARHAREVAIGCIAKPYDPRTIIQGVELAERILHGETGGHLQVPRGMDVFWDAPILQQQLTQGLSLSRKASSSRPSAESGCNVFLVFCPVGGPQTNSCLCKDNSPGCRRLRSMAKVHVSSGTRLNTATTVILIFLAVLVSLLALGAVITLATQERARHRRGPYVTAIDPFQGQRTRIDEIIEPVLKRLRSANALQLLDTSAEAFGARLSSAQLAGRSLDLMYYYWAPDITGRILARELLLAARRGVRVRLLLDDFNSAGLDSTYIALDSHPNIDVRLFNPSRSRDNRWRRWLELVFRYFTATRRMHNKCWIADGKLVIAGGRNIGDAYFDASSNANFRDIDVLLAGDAVLQANAIFDAYWNSASSTPIRSLHPIRRPRLAKLAARLESHCASEHARSYLKLLGKGPSDIAELAVRRWYESDDVSIIADPPQKAAQLGDRTWLANEICTFVCSARSRLQIISPYFIPGRAGLEMIGDLEKKGVQVSILTNSLAATDVLAVHGAYARYRKPLIGLGAELFELSPEPKRRRASLFGSSTASLHTKAIIVDGARGFVGSFNFDPRSASINTEMGVLFGNKGMARELMRLHERMTSPQESFRLMLNGGTLQWVFESVAGQCIVQKEPATTLLRRFTSAAISWLPIESQL
jgi:putative cardiolipin synthase